MFYSDEGVLCVERINSFNLAFIAAENGLAHVEIRSIRRRVSSLNLLSIVVSGANDLVRPTSSDGIGRAVAGDVCAAATLAVSARSPAPPEAPGLAHQIVGRYMGVEFFSFATGRPMITNIRILILLLAVVAGAAVVASRSKIPAAILLVLIGLALSLAPGLPSMELAPEFVLLFVLPPVIYSSAFNMSWREFRFNLRPITLMSVGGVLFTTIAVAAAAHGLMGLDWPIGFLLGAIISPPDAVAPLAIARGMEIPRRSKFSSFLFPVNPTTAAQIAQITATFHPISGIDKLNVGGLVPTRDCYRKVSHVGLPEECFNLFSLIMEFLVGIGGDDLLMKSRNWRPSAALMFCFMHPVVNILLGLLL